MANMFILTPVTYYHRKRNTTEKRNKSGIKLKLRINKSERALIFQIIIIIGHY